jgi:hypothetical protein
MKAVWVYLISIGLLPALARAEVSYPHYCGPVLKTLTCVGTQSNVQYDLFLTAGPDTNGCVVFDYGEGETNIYGDGALLEKDSSISWANYQSLRVGVIDDRGFLWHYMELERVGDSESFTGYFNYQGFTGGHSGPGVIGDHDSVECQQPENVQPPVRMTSVEAAPVTIPFVIGL